MSSPSLLLFHGMEERSPSPQSLMTCSASERSYGEPWTVSNVDQQVAAVNCNAWLLKFVFVGVNCSIWCWLLPTWLCTAAYSLGGVLDFLAQTMVFLFSKPDQVWSWGCISDCQSVNKWILFLFFLPSSSDKLTMSCLFYWWIHICSCWSI